MPFLKAFMELKKMRADFAFELRTLLTIVEIDKGMRRGTLRTLAVFGYPVSGVSDINRFYRPAPSGLTGSDYFFVVNFFFDRSNLE